MKSEIEAGLELLKANCSKGKVLVEAGIDSPSIYVTLFAPKDEQDGLYEKLRSVEPFKGKDQIYTLGVVDLKPWQCVLEKYSSQIKRV